MAATHDYQLPYAPNHVWNTLPAAVQRSRKASSRGNPVPGGGYRYSYSTGMSLLTWGFSVFVELHPTPQGTHLRISPKMNFGIFDWGEGREIANDLHFTLMQTLQAAPGQGPGPGPGAAPGPAQGHGPAPRPGPHGPGPHPGPGPGYGYGPAR